MSFRRALSPHMAERPFNSCLPWLQRYLHLLLWDAPLYPLWRLRLPRMLAALVELSLLQRENVILFCYSDVCLFCFFFLLESV